MGASTFTDVLDLPLFGDTDKPSWRGDVNGANNKLEAAHNTTQGRIGDVEGRATALEGRADDLEDRTTDVALAAQVAAWVKANFNDVYASKYLPGAASDYAALNLARDAAIARKARLVIDDIGRDWVIDASLTFDTLTDFSFHMEGRIKRADAATRVSLIYIKNCVGFRAGVIRTNGNVANNGYDFGAGVVPVDEAKHSVRIEGGSNIKIQRTHAYNPAGDGVYIVSSANNVFINHSETVSDAATGRNTVSIVQGDNITINSVVCRGTGYTTMPGGLDIEPNTGQTASNISIGTVDVQTQGTGGCTVVGAFTAAGVRQIKNVQIATVNLIKNAGVVTNATDVIVRGVVNCYIGKVSVTQDAASTHVACAIDDCDDVRLPNLDIPRAGKPMAIGANAAVTNLFMRGRYVSASSHAISITALSDAEIDMQLRCLAAGGLLVVKQATGTSANVKFRGNWRKEATAGTGVMQLNGTVSDWVMEGCDCTGWEAANRLVIGVGNDAFTTGIKRINCKGINYLTAAPTTNTGDSWAAGEIVWNSAPAAAGAPGWVCTTGGRYGTYIFKAMANLAA